jgi:hypothetical protein
MGKFLNMLLDICAEVWIMTCAKVKSGKHCWTEFKINKCWKKVYAIARLLCNVVLEIAIRRSKLEIRGTTFDECSQIMANVNCVIMGTGLKDCGELFK